MQSFLLAWDVIRSFKVAQYLSISLTSIFFFDENSIFDRGHFILPLYLRISLTRHLSRIHQALFGQAFLKLVS